LIDALKEPANRGPGNVLISEPSSTRDAAVMALVAAGPPGASAFTEKGVPILVAALADKNPAIREHAAVALARAGALAKPAVEALWPLTADPSPNVRAAGYDALRAAGPASAAPLAKLLTHESADVRARAAEAVSQGGYGPIPGSAATDLANALDDEDPAVRGAAADGLSRLGAAAGPAVPKLVALFGKTTPEDLMKPDPLELAAFRAVVGIGEPAVGPLTAALADRNPVVRLQAVAALGEIGPAAKAALPDIEKLLRDPVGAVALEAAAAATRVGGNASNTADLMKLALTNDDPDTRAAGLRTALRMGPAGKPLAPLVLPLFADTSDIVRRLAVEFAGGLGADAGAQVVPALAKVLKEDTAESVRRRAAEILASLGPAAAPAADALGAATADESLLVQRVAVTALGDLGAAGKPGLPQLAKLAADEKADAGLRAAAVIASVKVDGTDAGVAAALVKALGEKAVDGRMAAADAARAGPVGKPVLEKLAALAKSDPNPGVKLAAARALAEQGPAAAPVRAALDELAKGPPQTGGLWAAVALARIAGKPADALPAVRSGLGSKQLAEKMAAVQALPLVAPTPADVAKLGEFFKDKSANFRRAAVESAGRCGPAAAGLASKVMDLLRDKDTDVRIAAAVALGEFGDRTADVLNALRAARAEPVVADAARRSLRKLGGS
jgi:HEAT repeat protein